MNLIRKVCGVRMRPGPWLLGLVTCVVCAEHSRADELLPGPLGLRDALTGAMRRNPRIISHGIDVAVAQAEVLRAAGADDVMLDVTGRWDASRVASVARQDHPFSVNDRYELRARLTRRIPFGGELGLDLGTSYSHQIIESGTPEAQDLVFDVHTPQLSLSYMLPLLRGLGLGVVHADLNRAEVRRDAAVIARESVAAEVARDVIRGYWELVYGHEELRIRRLSLALAQAQLESVAARITAAQEPPTAAASVEATIGMRQDEMAQADKTLADRSVELREIMGLPIGPDDKVLEVNDPLGAIGGEQDPDPRQALARALERSPRLAVLRSDERTASIDLDLAQDALDPQLDLTLRAGPLATADSLRGAWELMGALDGYAVRTEVTFSMPLGGRTASGTYEAARHTLRRARRAREGARAELARDVVRALNAVRAAGRRIGALSKTTQHAQVSLAREQALYHAGHATSSDVLLRQEELAEAELRQLRAKVDHLIAVAELEWLTGDLLARHQISVRRPRDKMAPR